MGAEGWRDCSARDMGYGKSNMGYWILDIGYGSRESGDGELVLTFGRDLAVPNPVAPVHGA